MSREQVSTPSSPHLCLLSMSIFTSDFHDQVTAQLDKTMHKMDEVKATTIHT
jgi:hypothetical protein